MLKFYFANMASLKFLTTEQKQFWQENGFIKLTNVYSAKEVNEISDAYNEIFERKHRENLGLEASWAGNDMKKLAGFNDYSVSEIYKIYNSYIFIFCEINIVYRIKCINC